MNSNEILNLCFLTRDENILMGLSNCYLQTGIALLLCFENTVSSELPLKHISKQCKKWKISASIPQKNLETIKYLIEAIVSSFIIWLFLLQRYYIDEYQIF